MYTLAMTINHHYWECDHKYYYDRQVKKKALKSYSQKQGKASTAGNAVAFQNKTNINIFLVVSSTKLSPFKLFLSSTLKKQSNSPWVDLSSKLASNSKLTSDECKKYLENNLYLYYSAKNIF